MIVNIINIYINEYKNFFFFQGRKRAEDLNERVMIWSFFVTAGMVIVGFTQVCVLKSFFSEKRPSAMYGYHWKVQCGFPLLHSTKSPHSTVLWVIQKTLWFLVILSSSSSSFITPTSSFGYFGYIYTNVLCILVKTNWHLKVMQSVFKKPSLFLISSFRKKINLLIIVELSSLYIFFSKLCM